MRYFNHNQKQYNKFYKETRSRVIVRPKQTQIEKAITEINIEITDKLAKLKLGKGTTNKRLV